MQTLWQTLPTQAHNFSSCSVHTCTSPGNAGNHGAATSFHLPAGRPRGAASFSNHQPEKSRGAAGPSFLVQSADALSQNDARDVPDKKQVLDLHTRKAGVLTRISAIMIINPQTGNSLNVYAQHDLGC